MKVVAFNGSPRKSGNTAILIKQVFGELEKNGIETELIQLGGKKIKGCIACGKCFENKNKRCIFNDDILNECLEKMIEADGIIIGSPTYFANVTTEVKALIDRSGFVAIANDRMLKRKIGAAVVAVRRAGAANVFDAINKLFMINQMIVPGSSYWNLGIGLDKGDVENDEEGLKTMSALGENISWLLKKIVEQKRTKNMKIDHIAIWTKNIENLKSFYEKYFNANSNNKYINSKKNFESYFLSFESGTRIELMQKPEIPDSKNDVYKQFMGIIHLSFELESEKHVDELTEQLKNDGMEILDGPRRTGDGSYETAFLDPEGNRVEIMN